jgi:hypothetical protein
MKGVLTSVSGSIKVKEASISISSSRMQGMPTSTSRRDQDPGSVNKHQQKDAGSAMQHQDTGSVSKHQKQNAESSMQHQ